MAAELDKSGRAIREMFAGVAPRYDLLNHVLSASLDLVWRRKAAAALGVPAGVKVLDLCCGTGDQASALARRGMAVAGADFCVPMLAIARRKMRRQFGPHGGAGADGGQGPGRQLGSPASGRADDGKGSGNGKRPALLAADALALPFAAGRFRGATVSFGLRNVADLDAALGQLAAVLAPGGRIAVLEFAIPRARPLGMAYLFYFTRLLPWIGRLFSHRGSAYSYLPSSVLQFPQRRGFLERMAAAGFDDLAWEDLSGGIVCLYTGKRAGGTEVGA